MSHSHIPVITIDGPTASGKGTVAHKVADRLGFHYLDSGALYRLTALMAIRRDTPLTDEHALAKLAEHLPVTFVGGDILLANEHVAHLIRAVEDLSDVVARQSKDLDRLLRLTQLLAEREAEREASGNAPEANVKPPHW